MKKINHFFSDIESALIGAIEIRWIYHKEGIYVSHKIYLQNNGKINVKFMIY